MMKMIFVKIIFLLLILSGISLSQVGVTPHIRFQVTDNSDYLIAYDPNTYIHISEYADTVRIIDIRVISDSEKIYCKIPVHYNMIELIGERRLAPETLWKLSYKRKISDPFRETAWSHWFGFVPSYGKPIVLPVEKIN